MSSPVNMVASATRNRRVFDAFATSNVMKRFDIRCAQLTVGSIKAAVK